MSILFRAGYRTDAQFDNGFPSSNPDRRRDAVRTAAGM